MPFSHPSLRTATAVLALAALAACSSKKNDDAPTPVGMSWTVDGAAVNTTTVQSQKSSSTVSVAGTTTSGGTSSYVSLQIPNAVGTYNFSSSPLALGTYSSTSGTTTAVYYAGTLPASTGGMYTLGTGTIVVTALTATNVMGTFAFTGVGSTSPSKSITNGVFNVGL